MGCSFYDYAYADGEQTFTNTSGFEEIHTLDFTAPALGDYLILVSFYLTLSTSNGIGPLVQEVQLIVDPLPSTLYCPGLRSPTVHTISLPVSPASY